MKTMTSDDKYDMHDMDNFSSKNYMKKLNSYEQICMINLHNLQ